MGTAVSAADQCYCLRWKDFCANMSSALCELRDEGRLLDVTLVAGGRTLGAHRLVLAACSPLFAEMMVSAPRPVVFLHRIRYADAAALLDFVYRGEVNVNQEDLRAFLEAAEELKIRGLAGGRDEAGQFFQPPTRRPEFAAGDDASCLSHCVDGDGEDGGQAEAVASVCDEGAHIFDRADGGCSAEVHLGIERAPRTNREMTQVAGVEQHGGEGGDTYEERTFQCRQQDEASLTTCTPTRREGGIADDEPFLNIDAAFSPRFCGSFPSSSSSFIPPSPFRAVLPGYPATEHHPPPRPTCPHCGKEMKNSRSLNVHVSRYHGRNSQVGQVLCPVCRRTYGNKYSLRTHMHINHKEQLHLLGGCSGRGGDGSERVDPTPVPFFRECKM